MTHLGTRTGRFGNVVGRPTSRFQCITDGCTRLASMGMVRMCRHCMSDKRRRREQEPQR